MNTKDFGNLFHDQIATCEEVLVGKEEEYSDGKDRLHNFKLAAALEQKSVRAAVGGMMVKHTVSVYDIIHGDTLPAREIVEEKITDHINYLILLKAAIIEEMDTASSQSQLDFDLNIHDELANKRN